jgi:hypothetical protein
MLAAVDERQQYRQVTPAVIALCRGGGGSP